MQQLFRLLIFLIQPYMFRATNSPILRSTFWLYINFLIECTGRQQCRCILSKDVHTIKKCSWGWVNLAPETCRAELKRLINENVVASCWLFISLYFSQIFEKKNVHVISRKSIWWKTICSMRTDKWTEAQTYMTKLVFAFRNLRTRLKIHMKSP